MNNFLKIDNKILGTNYIKMRKIIKILKWVWQLPQNLLALCIEGILCQSAYRLNKKAKGNTIIVNNVFPTSVSFGDYIFVTPNINLLVILHECGHSKQSDILGPLYLIIIGIPSLLHNIIHKLCKKIGINWNYYSFYTEYWADSIMKINRNNLSIRQIRQLLDYILKTRNL